MWRIENPIIQKARLDFTSSGQGHRDVSRLLGGGIVLMNALELMEWGTDRTQLIICNECGIEGCALGGWVALRRTGDRIFMIPAFEEMEQDEESRTEYGPPPYLRADGVPYFDFADYEALAETGLGFPALDQIRPLEMREAMRLAQMEMPFRMFGDPPDIKLTSAKSLVVAASDGDPAQHLSTIDDILRTYYESREAAVLRERRVEEEIISLFLDAAEFTDWEALVRTENVYRLLLGETFVIEPQA